MHYHLLRRIPSVPAGKPSKSLALIPYFPTTTSNTTTQKKKKKKSRIRRIALLLLLPFGSKSISAEMEIVALHKSG